MRIIPVLFALAGALIASPGLAEPPERESTLVVYGDDPCPKSEGDEIVVCHRRPEGERYRIPRKFRDPPRKDTASAAWSQQWQQMEDAARFTRPNSCSVVGSGGQTGCLNAMLRLWWLERRQGIRR